MIDPSTSSGQALCDAREYVLTGEQVQTSFRIYTCMEPTPDGGWMLTPARSAPGLQPCPDPSAHEGYTGVATDA